MSKNYIVTAPMVGVTVSQDLRYLSRGAPVPGDVDAKHVTALLELGFIAEAKDVAGVQTDTIVVPDGDPADTKAWTLEALARYGETHGYEIPKSATKKADIVKVLAAAKAAAVKTAGSTPANPEGEQPPANDAGNTPAS